MQVKEISTIFLLMLRLVGAGRQGISPAYSVISSLARGIVIY